jgi:hypothetical protein
VSHSYHSRHTEYRYLYARKCMGELNGEMNIRNGEAIWMKHEYVNAVKSFHLEAKDRSDNPVCIRGYFDNS